MKRVGLTHPCEQNRGTEQSPNPRLLLLLLRPPSPSPPSSALAEADWRGKLPPSPVVVGGLMLLCFLVVWPMWRHSSLLPFQAAIVVNTELLLVFTGSHSELRSVDGDPNNVILRFPPPTLPCTTVFTSTSGVQIIEARTTPCGVGFGESNPEPRSLHLSRAV